MTELRHTRTGWWLEEATAAFGPVEPEPALSGDTSADVLVVGGGYLGMWTAWHAKELEPEADVLVVDAAPVRPRPERPQRRVRVDAVGRPADAAGARRRRAARSPSAAPPNAPFAGSLRGASPRRSTPGTSPAGRSTSPRPTRRSATGTTSSRPVGRSEHRRRRSRSPRPRCSGAVPHRCSAAAGCCSPSPPTCSRRVSRSGCARGSSRAECGSASTRASSRLGRDAVAPQTDGGSDPRAHGGARGQLPPQPGSPGTAGARGRLEPHRPDRAGARRPRGARLDGR